MITSLVTGGAERLVVSAATGLPDEFESAVCCFSGRGPLSAPIERAGVPVWCVGDFPGPRHPVSFLRLLSIIRTFRPHIVHTHLQAPNVYGRLAAWICSVPAIVATEHNVYTAKSRRHIAMEHWLTSRTSAIVAVSDEVRSFLHWQLHVHSDLIRVIRNGIAPIQADPATVSSLRRRWTAGATGVVVGTVASLTAKKGHAFLLRAAADLARRGLRCRLVFAGDGPERNRLEALMAELSGFDVEFLGDVTNVGDILGAIDLFVLPSIIEGMPLALLEAMAAGKPAIATSVGGVPEVIEDGVNGLLVKPGSPGQLADAIQKFAGDPQLRVRCGSAARKTALRSFTERQYLDSLAALYRDVVPQ